MSDMDFQREAWGHYWRSGPTHSCFDANGPVDTAPWWQSIVEGLADDARVLDLACGGGALGRLLLSVKPMLKVTGVDYVSAPGGSAEGIETLGGVSLDALPFDDGSYDAALSQFGLEYAPVEGALKEALRVVRPGGVLAFLMHQAGSAVAMSAGLAIESIADLLADKGLVRAAIALSELKASNQPTQQLENIIAQMFQAATQKPLTPERRWALDFFAEVMENQQDQPAEYLGQNAKILFAELKSMELRLGSMQKAALDEDALSDMVDVLAPFATEAPLLTSITDDQGNPVDWMLSARKQ